MFTYNLNELQTSRRTQMRFAMSDTVAPGYLQDEEIDFLLSKSADDNVVAHAYCEQILTGLAMEGTYDLGPLKVDTSEAVKFYTSLLRKYANKLGTGSPYMAELRESTFSVGMHSNKE